jgi:hypothetical protein
MPNFHIDQRLKNQRDIVRTYQFDLIFPQIDKVCTSFKDPQDLLVRCKSAVIPSRGNEIIETNLYGMKQFFPSKPTFGHVLNVTIEEWSDQKSLKAIDEWQNLIFQTDPNGPNAGASQVSQKRQGTGKSFALDGFITQYDYNGIQLGQRIQFVNAFPTQRDDVQLSYNSSEAIMYNVSFQFDYWKFVA